MGVTVHSSHPAVIGGAYSPRNANFISNYADVGYGKGSKNRAPAPPHRFLPSSSSSSSSNKSWPFPRSQPQHQQFSQHPDRHNLKKGGSPCVPPVHPHVREIVENQTTRHNNGYNRMFSGDNDENDDGNVVHGLHMDHYVTGKNSLVANSEEQEMLAVVPKDKGCIGNTADDVGYLFGCGTTPQEEIMEAYYDAQQKYDEEQQFLRKADDINDILLRIHKEFNSPQTMGGPNARHSSQEPLHHSEFLQDPIFNYENGDDDEDYSRTGCVAGSFQNFVDFFHPSSRKNSRGRRSSFSCLRKLSPRRKRSNAIFRPNYGIYSSQDSPRREKYDNMNSVSELQDQLKAMVVDRARRQVDSNPTSPPRAQDVDRLRQEQKSLHDARKMLQMELEKHQYQQSMQQTMQQMQQQQTQMQQQQLQMTMQAATMAQQQMMQNNTTMQNNAMGMMSPPMMQMMATQQQANNPMYSPVNNLSGNMNCPLSPPMSPVPNSIFVNGQTANDMGNMNANTFHNGMIGNNLMGNGVSNNMGNGLNTNMVTNGYNLNSNVRQHQPSPRNSFSEEEERFLASNRMLNDLKVKNSVIRQDLQRLRNCMSSDSGGPKGGAGHGMRVGNNSYGYTSRASGRFQDDINRAMQRSDEARYQRSV